MAAVPAQTHSTWRGPRTRPAPLPAGHWASVHLSSRRAGPQPLVSTPDQWLHRPPCLHPWRLPLSTGPPLGRARSADRGTLTCSASHTGFPHRRPLEGCRSARASPRTGSPPKDTPGCDCGGQCRGEQRPRGEWREDRRQPGRTWGTPQEWLRRRAGVAWAAGWRAVPAVNSAVAARASGRRPEMSLGPAIALRSHRNRRQGSGRGEGPASWRPCSPQRGQGRGLGVPETGVFRLRPCSGVLGGSGTGPQPERPPEENSVRAPELGAACGPRGRPPVEEAAAGEPWAAFVQVIAGERLPPRGSGFADPCPGPR